MESDSTSFHIMMHPSHTLKHCTWNQFLNRDLWITLRLQLKKMEKSVHLNNSGFYLCRQKNALRNDSGQITRCLQTVYIDFFFGVTTGMFTAHFKNIRSMDICPNNDLVLSKLKERESFQRIWKKSLSRDVCIGKNLVIRCVPWYKGNDTIHWDILWCYGLKDILRFF